MASLIFQKEELFYESIKNGLMSISYRISANKDSKNEKDKLVAYASCLAYLDSILVFLRTDTYTEEFKKAFMQEDNYKVVIMVIDEILKCDNPMIRDTSVDIRSMFKKIFNERNQ